MQNATSLKLSQARSLVKAVTEHRPNAYKKLGPEGSFETAVESYESEIDNLDKLYEAVEEIRLSISKVNSDSGISDLLVQRDCIADREKVYADMLDIAPSTGVQGSVVNVSTAETLQEIQRRITACRMKREELTDEIRLLSSQQYVTIDPASVEILRSGHFL